MLKILETLCPGVDWDQRVLTNCLNLDILTGFIIKKKKDVGMATPAWMSVSLPLSKQLGYYLLSEVDTIYGCNKSQ